MNSSIQNLLQLIMGVFVTCLLLHSCQFYGTGKKQHTVIASLGKKLIPSNWVPSLFNKIYKEKIGQNIGALINHHWSNNLYYIKAEISQINFFISVKTHEQPFIFVAGFLQLFQTIPLSPNCDMQAEQAWSRNFCTISFLKALFSEWPRGKKNPPSASFME